MELLQIASTLDPIETQAAYYALQQTFNAGWLANQIISIFLPLLLFFTGWGSSAYDFLLRHLRAWAAAAFAFFFLITFVTSAAQSAVVHAVLMIKSELDGSALPTLILFLSERLPTAAFTSTVAAIVGIALCYILEKKNRLTWLWLSIFITALLSFALLLVPYFSETEPLGNTPVEGRLAALSARAGVPADRIAKEDCANISECPPGRVIGIGPTRLMVLDSMLTSRTPEDQLLQVVAHEAKHYVLDNTIKPVAAIFVFCATLILLTQALSSRIVARHQTRNTEASSQPILVPVVYGLGLAIFVLMQPAITTFRRSIELEADRFGLELNRDNQALISIMKVDAVSNPMLLEYTPMTKFFRERIQT